MPHKYETTRKIDSEVLPGVVFYLYKMTEKRRLDLRKRISESSKRIREILREQSQIEQMVDEKRDHSKWLELQEEFDGIMIEVINPAWIEWGVKQVEGLEVDGHILTVNDYQDWPSFFFDEVINAVKGEAELNGAERKNLESLTTSGEPVVASQSNSTATSVDEKVTGKIVTASYIS